MNCKSLRIASALSCRLWKRYTATVARIAKKAATAPSPPAIDPIAVQSAAKLFTCACPSQWSRIRCQHTVRTALADVEAEDVLAGFAADDRPGAAFQDGDNGGTG